MPEPVISEDQRLRRLGELGFSAPLQRMAAGHPPHPALACCRSGPPWYAYHGARLPEGPPLIPLWDLDDRAIAVRAHADGPEFIRFSIEAPDRIDRLARTEPGFWATQFDFMYELDLPIETLFDIARALDYRYLPLQLDSRSAAEEQLDSLPRHRAWLCALVASIDALAANAGSSRS